MDEDHGGGAGLWLIWRCVIRSMFQDETSKRRGRRFQWMGTALLLAALLAAYANHFHNGFHFDDAHTIVNNAAIRETAEHPALLLRRDHFQFAPE